MHVKFCCMEKQIAPLKLIIKNNDFKPGLLYILDVHG